MKCLIAVTPDGGACFISDIFEGSIDDVAILTPVILVLYSCVYDWRVACSLPGLCVYSAISGTTTEIHKGRSSVDQTDCKSKNTC